MEEQAISQLIVMQWMLYPNPALLTEIPTPTI